MRRKTLATRERAQVRWESSESQGLPGTARSQSTLRTRLASLSESRPLLPAVGECQACAFPDRKTATGLFHMPSPRNESHALPRALLPGAKCTSSPEPLLWCCHLIILPLPPTRTSLEAGWVSAPQPCAAVVGTMSCLIFVAGVLFKKLSESFGSNNSFQGDLKERKCDINLT